MKCFLCGFKFSQEDAKNVCGKCLLSKRCGLIKCPNCGFEMAPEPEWTKNLKNKRRKR